MSMNRVEVKRIHVIIPMDLFIKLNQTKLLHEVDELITNYLYDKVEEVTEKRRGEKVYESD